MNLNVCAHCHTHTHSHIYTHTHSHTHIHTLIHIHSHTLSHTHTLILTHSKRKFTQCHSTGAPFVLFGSVQTKVQPYNGLLGDHKKH